MGLFKKKVTPSEFGSGALYMAIEYLASDAGRSLGMRFPNFDGSNGWGNFLQQQNIAKPVQDLYLRHFAHSAFQAASTQFDNATSRAMTQGAMSLFKEKAIDGYDFAITFDTLAAAYRGEHQFCPRVEQLNNAEAQLPFLSIPDAGVLNAKYLIESFVIPQMPNSDAFLADFESYSLAVSSGIATVQRAFEHLLRSVKLR